MNGLLAAAAEIQDVLQRGHDRFCFIGGIALQRWGEPRFTRDVDITLLCPYGEEASQADRLLGHFAARIPEARDFALKHRVILLNSAGDVPIDIALGAIPFEERCVIRATLFDFGGVRLLSCSAEDLIVMKAFAGRDRDWADIESVVMRQSAKLNWPQILSEITPLAELREGGNVLSRLETLRPS